MNLTSRCRVHDFQPGVLSNGLKVLAFTPDDLAHALFTTGRTPGDQAAHGLSSVYEWLHRVAVIPAYLRVAPGGGLGKSQLALELDRSEKVALSYSLGQAATAMFCRRYLGVVHLLHHDRYARHENFAYAANTNRRPDLIGIGANGWVVAEAKGRSNAMESALHSTLVEQKNAVRSINGHPPWVAVGCVASFPAPIREMAVDAFDPTSSSEDAVDLELPLDRFLLAYYAPFVAALDAGENMSDSDPRFEMVEFPGFSVTVGLLRPIADAVRRGLARSGGAPNQTRLSESLVTLLSQVTDVQFADGSLVRGEWDRDLNLGIGSYG